MLSCPKGHEWEADDAETPCPVCGSVAESLGDGESSTWGTGTGDELPPPPGAESITLVTGGPEVAPTVPGYEIVGELGRGGMGVVYEARHLALNRRVALKVIRGFAGRDEVARFRAEAEAVARLQHPNIVQIYEVGEHAGMPYLALEFVDGSSLLGQLRRAPLAPRTAAELVATLARAVQHAHSRGVVHRDLKPANILLTAEGAPKVGDFGLAKLGDDPGRSRSGLIVGTPSYMAPEQASGRGELVGPPADVWALGAILYECLSGRAPFLGASSVETMQRVLTDEPLPPGSARPGVPRDLETICLKCLRKERESRYRTAGDLADDLGRFLEYRPVEARRTPSWERVTKWARRRPAAAGLIAAVLVSGGVIAALGYGHFQNVEEHNRELEKYNADLEDKGKTITRNNIDLEARHATITQRTRELEVANLATVRERDRAERNLAETLAAIDGLLNVTGIDRLASRPHIDHTRTALLERALAVCDRLLAGQENNPRLRLFQAFTLQRAGRILLHLQRYEEAAERLDRALAVIAEHRRSAGGDAPDPRFAGVVALVRMDRGQLFLRRGDPKRASEEHAAALAATGGTPDPELKFLGAVSNANLAVAALDENDTDRALLYLGRARQALEELFGEDSKDAAYVGAYGFVLNTAGVAHTHAGDRDRAGELFEESVVVYRKVVKVLPNHVDYRAELARSLANYGSNLRLRGYLKRAAAPLAEALAMREELAGNHPDVGTLRFDFCWSLYQIGELHFSRNELEAAVQSHTRTIDAIAKIPPGLESRARELLMNVYISRGNAFGQREDYAEMAADFEAAAKLATGAKRVELGVRRALALSYAGENEKALAEAAASVKNAKEIPADAYFDHARILGRAAKAAKKPDEAADFARRAVAELTAAAEAGHFSDAKNVTLLDRHLDLSALRTRDDYKALRARVRGQ